MSRANPALLALLLASGCSAPPVPPLFDSRVPLEPPPEELRTLETLASQAGRAPRG